MSYYIPKSQAPSRSELIENEHYYINENGYWVFTEKYHKLRGYCCGNGCKHCPYQGCADANEQPLT